MNNKIAVIGMACKYPGAKTLDEFWRNLVEGKDTIKRFTDEELLKSEFDLDNLRNNPDFVKARGVLDDVEQFDPDFFGMTTKEAAITDPQHRIWLEIAWEAFENAGVDPIDNKGAIGVFAGGYISTYLLNNILRDSEKFENFIRLRNAESYQILTCNDPSFIPTKTAYKLNLRGPAIYIQTACSTSLVAVIQACHSLYSYESDICLAGGICISVPQETGYIYQEGAIPSPDGYCRPFDALASGTVASNGAGAVVLKRLDDAINDKDSIYAVISGWAVNNDGSNKVSYNAPGIDGQAEVIMMAQSFAEVLPENISYIEAHGTATNLGDPVEIKGLTKAFSAKTNKKQFCGIGSVKSNIGHTDAAAGVAGLIKTCLAAYYKTIPPSLHYLQPNPKIDFVNSPFFVQKELKIWKEDRPLIMGVSSFGIGGTNAHVIVEQIPSQKQSNAIEPEWPNLILLSARSQYSLNRRKTDLIDHIRSNPHINLSDVSYTLIKGRSIMPHRSFTIASGLGDILGDENNFTDNKTAKTVSKIVFMFPGQGAQYVAMGRDLYNSNELFKNILDDCFEIVRNETGEDLKFLLLKSKNDDENDKRLSRTDLAQAALFIVEYALAQVFMEFKICPSYLIGHSIGEYVAACLSGVFDLKTALKIVVRRGQLMNNMPEGRMMAVRTDIEQLKRNVNSYFEIAAYNSSSFCTISFKREDTDKIERLLEKNNIPFVPLNTSHAFHSSDFDPILEEFAEFVDKFNLLSPNLPFISCLTGVFITANQATSGSYWAQQLRHTVLFRKGISTLAETDDTIFLEVGPGNQLSTLAMKNEDISFKNQIISTLGKSNNIDERFKVLNALGNMFILGIKFDAEALFKGTTPKKISLPTYPFERRRCWIDVISNGDKNKSNQNNNLREDFSVISDGGKNKKIATSSISSTPGSLGDHRELTPTEKIIIKIWSDAFMREGITIIDNFFEIGGDSLQALTVISKIRTVFKVELPLRIFLEKPRISDIARFVDNSK